MNAIHGAFAHLIPAPDTLDEQMAALVAGLNRLSEIERELAQESLSLAADLRAIIEEWAA